MRSRLLMNNRGWVGSAVLLGTLLVTASSLVAWKHAAARKADAAAASQPEPIESVTLAVARARQYRPTTTSVGTVLALNSITLRNELSGTVRQVMLAPGRVVDSGTVLVALDVSVEEAELQAEQAQADLAATSLARLEVLRQAQATSQEEVDPAPGASVRVEVPTGPSTTVVAIPVSALRKGPGGDHVFLIAADSAGHTRAHVQPVQSGPVLDDDVVILSGLTPGQQVATSGSFKLRESVRVAGDSTR